MTLKNARSDSTRTFDVIQKCLATHGAQKVMFDYNQEGRVIGFAFMMDIHSRQIGFRLPARIENVERIMYGEKDLTPAQKEQAYRTAWANIRDWITAQMALIDTEMVKAEEVFLPYMIAKNGQTLYESIEHRGFMLQGGDESK